MPQVDELVHEAAERFKGLGAGVESVSVPMHRDGGAIWLAVAAEGALMQMMLGNGFGFNWQGLCVTSMLDFHSSWRNRADELSDTLKNTMLLGHYMVTRYRGQVDGIFCPNESATFGMLRALEGAGMLAARP